LSNKRKILIILISVGGAALAGKPLSAQTFTPADLSGAELFGRYCASCHGPEGRGNGPVAPSLRTTPANLRLLASRGDGRFPAADIRQQIDGRAMGGAHGTREMPIWGYEFWVEEGGDITAEQAARDLIDRLVEFLASIQDGPGRPGDRD